MFAEEINFARDAEILVHLNEDEAALFRTELPSHRHELIFPSARRAYNSPRRFYVTEDPFDFLIVASANHPNYMNLRWFLAEVWSHALDRRFHLKIVGNVDREFLARSDRLYDRYRHCFVGRVPALDHYYYNARAVLLPVVAGHGIAIKAVEAMSYGKPIIATPGAFRGFGGRIPASLTQGLAESAEDFRNKISHSLPMPIRRPTSASSTSTKISFPLKRIRKAIGAYWTKVRTRCAAKAATMGQ